MIQFTIPEAANDNDGRPVDASRDRSERSASPRDPGGDRDFS